MKYYISILFFLAFATPATAGEITRANNSSDFQWKSTECPRPIPKPAGTGLSEQDRLMAYSRDIAVYIDCIKREAQRDFDKAQEKMHQAVQRDVQKDVDLMNDMMLEAAKTMR